MRLCLKALRFLLICSPIFFGSACHRAADEAGTGGGSTAVSIRIPTAQEFNKLSSKVGSQSVSAQAAIDYDLLCFAVNVKGAGIPTTPAQSCEIERGIINGSVPAGGALTLDLPAGVASFEIYGFLRTSASQGCPTFLPSGWDWPLQKTYFLGRANSITLTPPEANVAISISLPDAAQNLVVQNSWSASCANVGSPVVAKNLGRLQTGTQILTGTNFTAYSRVSNKADMRQLQGTYFQVHNWKASLQ